MLAPKLLACRVLADELAPFLSPETAIESFDISLHVAPSRLRECLQQAIDVADGHYDPILLGYGLCAQAVVGLCARRSRLAVFRADDCIELFLGSRQARVRELHREPGTYFLTSGYIGQGNLLEAEYERCAQRYGATRAERLLQQMMSHYKRLIYLRMPHGTDLENDRGYARRMATRFRLSYEEQVGETRWLRQLAQAGRSAVGEPNLVIVPPGQPIVLSCFL